MAQYFYDLVKSVTRISAADKSDFADFADSVGLDLREEMAEQDGLLRI